MYQVSVIQHNFAHQQVTLKGGAIVLDTISLPHERVGRQHCNVVGTVVVVTAHA